MHISKKEFSNLIKGFRFKELFNELGWNQKKYSEKKIIDNIEYQIDCVGEKSNFHIFTCCTSDGIKMPSHPLRKKIEHSISQLFHENLIIFIDKYQEQQIWFFVKREKNKLPKYYDIRYYTRQDPELLYQKTRGLFFDLDSEDKITIVDVKKAVTENFNTEKVTKKFYERFKKEHDKFKNFISGISDETHLKWYTSVMLNRLMFCYFIQKQGFLDNNLNYLNNKLTECQLKTGTDQFYSFYRNFLLHLFFDGLGSPDHEHLLPEIGKIPYLNGGLFSPHEIEMENKNIAISDDAFFELFRFFDGYVWHLDTRPISEGNEINPDVIGYIFEKYINDRTEMGAYYTQEDITEYISKNSIIPWLFDEVKRNYPQAFKEDGFLWSFLKYSQDNYIYEAVKYGISEIKELPVSDDILFADLPEGIRKGFRPDLEDNIVNDTDPLL